MCLDLSKAYDCVSHYQLFTKLLRRGITIYFVKFLTNWYTSQEMQAKWRNLVSSHFSVRKGVQQGSVLSLRLFNLYTDDFLKAVAESGDGARVSDVFLGCLAYVDDIAL